MRRRLVGLAVAILVGNGTVAFAAWEHETHKQADLKTCLLRPASQAFAVELTDLGEGQRQTRIYLPRPRGLPGGSRHFVGTDTGPTAVTTTGIVDGDAAAKVVVGMLTARAVTLGYSQGNRPPEARTRISLEGFAPHFRECLQDLSWSTPASEQTPDSPVDGATGSRPVATSVSEPILRSDGTPASFVGLPDELRGAIHSYEAAPGPKALFVAVGTSGGYSYGYSAQESSVEEAVRVAAMSCEEGRRKWQVDGACTVYLVGSIQVTDLPAPTSTPPASDRSASTLGSASRPESETQSDGLHDTPPRYENQWVEGREYIVATAGDLQVWVAFGLDRGPHAFVYVVNGSDVRHTFEPHRIQALAVRRTRNGEKSIAMTTFRAEEYEKKVKDRQALSAVLFGLSAAMANQPQPRTYTYQGTSQSNVTAYGSAGWATGYGTTHYYGTITEWPSGADYANANARTAAQVGAMAGQLRASFDAMASTLARIHTLPPHSFYGGVVRFHKQRGDRYRLLIPFGGQSFSVEFYVR